MNFKINDVIKKKDAETIYLYKILELRKYGYWCAKGMIERDAFIENGEYVSINYMDEDDFCNINSYDMYMNKNFPTYTNIPDVKIHDIIALELQGKTHQEIFQQTNCSLDDIDVVLKTKHFLEDRETLEKGELVAKNNELKYENDAIKDELQRVYRAIAIHFLFKKDEY